MSSRTIYSGQSKDGPQRLSAKQVAKIENAALLLRLQREQNARALAYARTIEVERMHAERAARIAYARLCRIIVRGAGTTLAACALAWLLAGAGWL